MYLNMIDIDVEVHVLSNQVVKKHSERISRLVPSKREKSNSTRHILSVSLNTRPTRDAREVLEDSSLK